MNLFEIIIIVLGGLLGGLPTLYLIVEAVLVIVQKVYRKIKYNVSLYD